MIHERFRTLHSYNASYFRFQLALLVECRLSRAKFIGGMVSFFVENEIFLIFVIIV